MRYMRTFNTIGFADYTTKKLGNLLVSEMNMGTTSKVFPNRVQSGKRVVAMGGSLAVTVRTRTELCVSDVTASSRRGGLSG
jgi:hypothetical protein